MTEKLKNIQKRLEIEEYVMNYTSNNIKTLIQELEIELEKFDKEIKKLQTILGGKNAQ